MAMLFLLRHHQRTGTSRALELVRDTAEAMARGGIYDQLAGGFARYSVDERWLVPHFEKMLYDNALLLRAYTDLWRLTGDAMALRVATETWSSSRTDLFERAFCPLWTLTPAATRAPPTCGRRISSRPSWARATAAGRPICWT
jgi:uncharacterized protein YyaL (SSP411 family)